jgi:hypothetical protein
MILQGGKLRSISVPLDCRGVSFAAIAFATVGFMNADIAQRAYLAASSGASFTAAFLGARPATVHM